LAVRVTSGRGGTAAARHRFDPRRVYVALVFVPLFYLLVRYLPPAAFFALVTIASLLALAEFYNLHFRGDRLPVGIGIGLGAGALLLAALQWPGVVPDRGVLAATVVSVILYRLAGHRPIKDGLADAAVLVFGVLYVALMLGHLLLTRALARGEFLIFFVVLVTWAADTGAYYVGTVLGKHRLAPVISPNKTVEGLIGGVVLAVVAALVAQAWFLPDFSITDCLATGIILSVAGLFGDLAESAMKRSAGVKDSGWLLPAHGGMLDRLDSMLFTAPAFYYYMVLFKT
jgi:phosphatidate cytidylyltransferase